MLAQKTFTVKKAGKNYTHFRYSDIDYSPLTGVSRNLLCLKNLKNGGTADFTPLNISGTGYFRTATDATFGTVLERECVAAYGGIFYAGGSSYATRFSEGETYTQSVWLKASVQTDMKCGVETGKIYKLFTIGTEWQQVQITFNGSDAIGYTPFVIYPVTPCIFWVAQPKIEPGSIVTPFSWAPDDLGLTESNLLGDNYAAWSQRYSLAEGSTSAVAPMNKQKLYNLKEGDWLTIGLRVDWQNYVTTTASYGSYGSIYLSNGSSSLYYHPSARTDCFVPKSAGLNGAPVSGGKSLSYSFQVDSELAEASKTGVYPCIRFDYFQGTFSFIGACIFHGRGESLALPMYSEPSSHFYIGVQTTGNEIASENADDYNWSKIGGADSYIAIVEPNNIVIPFNQNGTLDLSNAKATIKVMKGLEEITSSIDSTSISTTSCAAGIASGTTDTITITAVQTHDVTLSDGTVLKAVPYGVGSVVCYMNVNGSLLKVNIPFMLDWSNYTFNSIKGVQASVDNLQIGGRNLIINSTGNLGTSNWTVDGVTFTSEVGAGIGGNNALRLVSPSNATARKNVNQFFTNLLPDKNKIGPLTLSFWYKISVGSDPSGVGCFVRLSNTAYQYNDSDLHMVNGLIIDGNWHFAKKTADYSKYDNSGTTTIQILLLAFKGTCDYSNINLQQSNKDNSWAPATEDILARIDSDFQQQIVKVDVEYALGDNSTTAPTTGWQTTSPVWTTGKFVWSRVKTYLQDGTSSTSDVACIQGATGKGISSIVEQYYKSTSATSLADGSWSDTVPVQERGYYIWTHSVISYTDNTTLTTNPVRTEGIEGLQGLQGPTGSKGVGISSVVEHYLATSASSGVTTATSGWTTAVQAITSSNKYLWNYETINYTEGSPANTTPVIVGVYGNTGKGISSVVEHYLATSAYSGVSTATSGWTTGVQSVNSTNKYLWNYETINYTEGAATNTTPVIIGTYGDKGDSAINYKLVPSKEDAIVTKGTADWQIAVSLEYQVQKTVGDQVTYISPADDGLTFSAFANTSVGTTEMNISISNGVISVTYNSSTFSGTNRFEQIIVGLAMSPTNYDTRLVNVKVKNDVQLTWGGDIEAIKGEIRNADGSFSSLKQRLDSIDSTVSGKVSTSVFNQLQDNLTLEVGRRKGNLAWYSGFEPLADWDARPNSGVANIAAGYYTLDKSVVKYPGVNSLKIQVTGLSTDSWAGLWGAMNVAVQPNTPYTFSFWDYTDSLASLESRPAYFEIKTFDSSGTVITTNYSYSEATPSADGTWQFFSKTFTTPATAVKISVFVGLTRNGRIWITCPNLIEGTKYDSGYLLAKDEGLLPAGINIQLEEIIARAKNFYIQNDLGVTTFRIDSAGNILSVGDASFYGRVLATEFMADLVILYGSIYSANMPTMPDGFMYYYGNVNNSSSNVANYYLPLVATNKIVHKRVVCAGVAPNDYQAVNLYANLDGDIIARQDASGQSQIRLTDNPNFQFGVNDGKLQISLLHGVFDLYGMNNDGFTVWYAVDNTPVSYEFDADGRVVSMSRLSTLVTS